MKRYQDPAYDSVYSSVLLSIAIPRTADKYSFQIFVVLV